MQHTAVKASRALINAKMKKPQSNLGLLPLLSAAAQGNFTPGNGTMGREPGSRNITAHETARGNRAAYSRDNNASGSLLSMHHVKEPASQRATGRSGVSIRGRVAVPRAIPEGWTRARETSRRRARVARRKSIPPARSSIAPAVIKLWREILRGKFI